MSITSMRYQNHHIKSTENTFTRYLINLMLEAKKRKTFDKKVIILSKKIFQKHLSETDAAQVA